MSKVHLIIFIIFLIIVATIRIWLNQPITLPKNQPLKFEATIKREPRIYDFSQVIYVADSRVYVDLYPRYRVGDRLLIEGTFDEKGRMFGASVEKIGERSGLLRFRSELRDKISKNVSALLPSREATLVVGTVLGVDTIGKQFRDELIKTGTIHVVVVSGQNLMIVAGIFLALARYVGRRQSMILAILAVFTYAFLTGFEPPVIRASIMVLVSSLAIFLGREASVIFSLVIAALMIVLIWPQALFEVSFQLTFAATLGIITLGQKLKEIFKKLPFLGENAAIATSAYLFTAPVILFYFSRVSPLAPIANILVAEVVFPIMILGFLIAFASLTFMPLAQVLAYFAYVPALYFSEVVRILATIQIF
ncbi:hypothetical protein A3B51_00810 [Candidatus Curtissbacteria bacterium RIFCSPLOWO2_01_FULL_41_18]|uniref:ComEC/Rec2-related protein domain-containing protein n=2 Tax=Candidatus Curtissiibacteriota TaxID=1752717 RepID=A0A1F5G0X5_9BACT|nr:MAG: hypothetical protein A2696_01115 [Candidatus Curtissbacteria bacterium RIFCSPHIGHO2_01_FULL_41_13]OGE05335.1 MAG: hypothetical protein A3B51_00810 [Candidatus Curtissbacteria bacterium RIFCSPLOWO2_01_FULL_41_18]